MELRVAGGEKGFEETVAVAVAAPTEKDPRLAPRNQNHETMTLQSQDAEWRQTMGHPGSL